MHVPIFGGSLRLGNSTPTLAVSGLNYILIIVQRQKTKYEHTRSYHGVGILFMQHTAAQAMRVFLQVPALKLDSKIAVS